MRLKRCKRCGKEFQAEATWIYLCPDCAAAAKRENVVRPRVCRACGEEFPGGPRAWYCPECRAERRRVRDLEYKRSGKPARAIGSIDICVRCGGTYTVASGRQMYCPNCAETAVREKVRPQKRDYWREHKDQYADRKREAAKNSKVCVVCGKSFSGRGSSVTCSDACAEQHRKAQQLTADIKRGRRKPRE